MQGTQTGKKHKAYEKEKGKRTVSLPFSFLGYFDLDLTRLFRLYLRERDP